MSDKHSTPSTNKLAEELSYDPASGVFTWLTDRGNQVRAGDVAGSLDKDGYTVIFIGHRVRKAHRLAFLLMTGKEPNGEVDHINGDRSDNRWANLREVDRTANCHNKTQAHKQNKSGLLGVTTNRRGFTASIKCNGVRHYLGYFATAEEAHAEYMKAKALMHVSAQPPQAAS